MTSENNKPESVFELSNEASTSIAEQELQKTDGMDVPEEKRRRIKSYAIRAGRMTAGQAQAYEEMLPTFGIEYQSSLFDFKENFNNDNPLVVEIGFGMGWSLAIQAHENPNNNYLGIEVHTPGVGSLLARLKENGATNVRMISHDAVEVFEHMIADGSIECVQLFFPDPWHKRKHHKRRIVKAEFIQQIWRKLKIGGVFHMATDWEDYAKHMLKEMRAETGWKNLSQTKDYIPRPDDRPMTKFEKRGARLGHGVWDLMYEKQSDFEFKEE